MEKSADAKVDKGASKVDPDDFYANLRYNIVPPAFLVFFTFITQILVVIGNPDLTFGFGFIFSFFTGLFSFFAWKGNISSINNLCRKLCTIYYFKNHSIIKP